MKKRILGVVLATMLSVNLGGVIAVASVQDNYVKTTQEACDIDMNQATQTPENQAPSTVAVDVNTDIEKSEEASSRSDNYTKLQTLSEGKSYKVTNTSSESVYLISFEYDDKSIVDSVQYDSDGAKGLDYVEQKGLGTTILPNGYTIITINNADVVAAIENEYAGTISIQESEVPALKKYTLESGHTYEFTNDLGSFFYIALNHDEVGKELFDSVEIGKDNKVEYCMRNCDIYLRLREGRTKVKVINSENVTVAYPYFYGDKVSVKEIGGDILRCYSIPAGETYKMTTNTNGVTIFSKDIGAKLEYSRFTDEKNSEQEYIDITDSSGILFLKSVKGAYFKNTDSKPVNIWFPVDYDGIVTIVDSNGTSVSGTASNSGLNAGSNPVYKEPTQQEDTNKGSTVSDTADNGMLSLIALSLIVSSLVALSTKKAR